MVDDGVDIGAQVQLVESFVAIGPEEHNAGMIADRVRGTDPSLIAWLHGLR